MVEKMDSGASRRSSAPSDEPETIIIEEDASDLGGSSGRSAMNRARQQARASANDPEIIIEHSVTDEDLKRK